MRVRLEGIGPDSFTGPWVSNQDRSPIRRVHTKHIVRNVTETAISYSELLLEAKRVSEANRWAGWADELDKKAELGPVFTGRLAQLKEHLAKETRKECECAEMGKALTLLLLMRTEVLNSLRRWVVLQQVMRHAAHEVVRPLHPNETYRPEEGNI